MNEPIRLQHALNSVTDTLNVSLSVLISSTAAAFNIPSHWLQDADADDNKFLLSTMEDLLYLIGGRVTSLQTFAHVEGNPVSRDAVVAQKYIEEISQHLDLRIKEMGCTIVNKKKKELEEELKAVESAIASLRDTDAVQRKQLVATQRKHANLMNQWKNVIASKEFQEDIKNELAFLKKTLKAADDKILALEEQLYKKIKTMHQLELEQDSMFASLDLVAQTNLGIKALLDASPLFPPYASCAIGMDPRQQHVVNLKSSVASLSKSLHRYGLQPVHAANASKLDDLLSVCKETAELGIKTVHENLKHLSDFKEKDQLSKMNANDVANKIERLEAELSDLANSMSNKELSITELQETCDEMYPNRRSMMEEFQRSQELLLLTQRAYEDDNERHIRLKFQLSQLQRVLEQKQSEIIQVDEETQKNNSNNSDKLNATILLLQTKIDMLKQSEQMVDRHFKAAVRALGHCLRNMSRVIGHSKNVGLDADAKLLHEPEGDEEQQILTAIGELSSNLRLDLNNDTVAAGEDIMTTTLNTAMQLENQACQYLVHQCVCKNTAMLQSMQYQEAIRLYYHNLDDNMVACSVPQWRRNVDAAFDNMMTTMHLLCNELYQPAIKLMDTRLGLLASENFKIGRHLIERYDVLRAVAARPVHGHSITDVLLWMRGPKGYKVELVFSRHRSPITYVVLMAECQEKVIV